MVTFDCYGTLIDWRAGIAGAFRDAGVDAASDAVLAAYNEIEPQVQRGPYRPYREVLGECARQVAARFGHELDDAAARFLARSLPAWPPFADTVAALRRLVAAGYRLGILSNVDDDLLAGTRRRLEVGFDPIVTAEQIRSYKPAPAHFEEARRRLGGARWLHAAQSHFHDVVPARRLAIPVAWVNRRGERFDDVRPDHEFPDLAGLADWLS